MKNYAKVDDIQNDHEGMDIRFKFPVIKRNIGDDNNCYSFEKKHGRNWTHQVEQKSGKWVSLIFIAAPFDYFPSGDCIQHI